VRSSFTEPDLFDNNVPFDNTTPIYLINLLWKFALGLGLDLELLCVYLCAVCVTTVKCYLHVFVSVCSG